MFSGGCTLPLDCCFVHVFLSCLADTTPGCPVLPRLLLCCVSMLVCVWLCFPPRGRYDATVARSRVRARGVPAGLPAVGPPDSVVRSGCQVRLAMRGPSVRAMAKKRGLVGHGRAEVVVVEPEGLLRHCCCPDKSTPSARAWWALEATWERNHWLCKASGT